MLDQTTTAFLFPGQGSQSVGMGKTLAEAYPIAAKTYTEADDILGFGLSALCFEGPIETLTDTANVQPALYIAGIAVLRVFSEVFGEFAPAYLAGHSLGELTALTAAGSMDFESGLKLVRLRGELMGEASVDNPGGMAAVLGLSIEAAQQVCTDAQAATGDVVVVANDNCPGQVVIAGGEKALTDAMEKAKEAGAKKVIRLPVSIAPHTPLMAAASEKFNAALDQMNFKTPTIPVMGNMQAEPLTTAEDIRAELSAQLTGAVRWTEGIQGMLEAGITTFIEMGNRDVLSGLVKRINRKATRHTLDTPENFEKLKG